MKTVSFIICEQGKRGPEQLIDWFDIKSKVQNNYLTISALRSALFLEPKGSHAQCVLGCT